MGNDRNSLIHHEGYYGVFGNIEGEDFDLEKYGVKISFAKDVSVPCDREGKFFWICINGDFPYVLKEERDLYKPDNDLPTFRSAKNEKVPFIKRVKSYFVKK